MNVSEARAILRPPLIFGDDEQIRAHKLLEQVEVAKAAICECRRGHEYEIANAYDTGVMAKRNSIAFCECVSDQDSKIRFFAACELVTEWTRGEIEIL